MSNEVRRNQLSIHCFALACTVLGLLSGCGGGEFPVSPAKGKVVSAGNPVTVGTVTFTPVGEGSQLGKPATAAVNPDGTFVLTTNDQFDGAVVGKHRVVYVGPEGEEESEEAVSSAPEGSAQEMAEYVKKVRESQAKKKISYVLPSELIVEVTDGGENDFTIEVVPAPTQQAMGRIDD